jgi:hypothetical protein
LLECLSASSTKNLTPSKPSYKKMKKIVKFKAIFLSLLQIFILSIIPVFAQQPPPIKPPAEDFTWWYILLSVLVAGLVGAIVWKVKSKKKDVIEKNGSNKSGKKDSEMMSFDADEISLIENVKKLQRKNY